MDKFGATGIICMILMLCLAVPSMARSHNVGDSAGWAFGVDYGTWASGKTFKVGDTLVFSYGSGHDVSEVSASDYAACNAGNAINTESSGATTIPLKTAGKHYFICGAMGHCAGGMKLAVTVAAGGDTAMPPESTISPAPSTTAVSESPLPPPATTAPSPTTIVVSQPPLLPNTVTTITTPAAVSGDAPLSSSAGTLSTFSALLFTCFVVIFKLVLA